MHRASVRPSVCPSVPHISFPNVNAVARVISLRRIVEVGRRTAAAGRVLRYDPISDPD